MKTTIQKTMWLFFIAVALISCSKDKDHCDPNDEESPCYAGPSGGAPGDRLLLIEEKINGKIVYTFEYDGQNRRVVWHMNSLDGGGATVKYTYEGSNKLIIERDNEVGADLIESYSYGGGNKPVSGVMTSRDQDGGVILELHVQYSYSQNTVTEKIFDEEDNLMATNVYTFDDNGNILSQGLAAGTIVFGDYDDKPNVYTNDPLAWKFGSTNNPLSITSDDMSTQIREYTYNDAGYPVKAEVYDGATKALVYTHEYTYKKAN